MRRPKFEFGKATIGGIEFLDENGGGPRVRLRKPPKQKR
jgi:hypothetical protein